MIQNIDRKRERERERERERDRETEMKSTATGQRLRGGSPTVRPQLTASEQQA